MTNMCHLRNLLASDGKYEEIRGKNSIQAFVYETKRAFIKCYMIKYLKDRKWKNYSCLFNFNVLY